MHPKSVLNDIRDRIPIASYIGERVALKRAGRNFKGLCPFHQEKTPSFTATDDKQMFHCFGCGEGGDIFKFVMKFEGLSFSEAVKLLAQRAGVELPRFQDPEEDSREKERQKKRRMLFRVNEIARDFFVDRLRDEMLGEPARKYLQHRGISKENSTQHFLGYADNSWDSLCRHLADKNVPMELAVELGLARERKEGAGHYDFFRDRLMFPIISPQGLVQGFGGRVMDGAPADAAKYMNSPDSAVYHKSDCVYGLSVTQRAIQTEDRAILVEGYMDLIALNEAGIMNIAAPLGTAFTAGHARLLSRHTRNFVVVFDGDRAGKTAAMRALSVFLEAGIMPRTVLLPDGEDPDSQVRKEGKDAFKKRLENAPSLFEFFVEQTLAETGADVAGRALAVKRIAPMLKLTGDAMEQGVYLEYAARRLDVDKAIIARAISSGNAAFCAPAAVLPCSAEGGRSVERALIEALLAYPELIRETVAGLKPELFTEAWAGGVIGRMKEEDSSASVSGIIGGIGDEKLAGELRSAAVEPRIAKDEARDFVGDCVRRITFAPEAKRMKELNDDIKRAEESGDDALVSKLLGEKKFLAAQLRK